MNTELKLKLTPITSRLWMLQAPKAAKPATRRNAKAATRANAAAR